MLTYKWPVIGNTPALAQLEGDFIGGNLSHAYLFEGPREVGKIAAARTFSQLLQCREGFCRTCHACRHIERGQHLDTLELRDDGESIKIDAIRELISHLHTTTGTSPHKIVIIENAERILPEAANVLLKILEEPVDGLMFILTVTQSHMLLDTIVSRVRRISFQPVPEPIIERTLREAYPETDSAKIDAIAAFAMGRPERALSLATDTDRFRSTQDIYQKIQTILQNSSLSERMVYVESIAKDPALVTAFFELFEHLVRSQLLQKARGGDSSYSFDRLFAILKASDEAQFDIEHNVNSRMVLENLMLNL